MTSRAASAAITGLDARRIIADWDAAVRALKAAQKAAHDWQSRASIEGSPQSRAKIDRRSENKLDRITNFDIGVFSARQISRAGRWEAAVAELRELLDEYQGWLDTLPENFQASPLAEKLAAMGEFESQVADLEGADLPQGFGRD